MRLVIATLAAATLSAAAVTALAAPVQPVSDVQFLEANRCLGLATSKPLASPEEAASLKQFIRSQSFGRMGEVYDRADQMRDDAQRDVSHSDADGLAKLTAERDGACRAFLTTTAAATPRQGGPSLQ